MSVHNLHAVLEEASRGQKIPPGTGVTDGCELGIELVSSVRAAGAFKHRAVAAASIPLP